MLTENYRYRCLGGAVRTGPFDVAPADLAEAMRAADPGGVLDTPVGRGAACGALLGGMLTSSGVRLGAFDELTIGRIARAVGPAGVQVVASWLSLVHGLRQGDAPPSGDTTATLAGQAPMHTESD